MSSNKLGYKPLRVLSKEPSIEGGKVVLNFNPEDGQSVVIKPGQIVRLQTGILTKFLPDLVAILTVDLSLEKKGVIQPHCLGVIDADYQNEVLFQLKNNGDKEVQVKVGDRLGSLELFEYNTAKILDESGIFDMDSLSVLKRKTTMAAGADIQLQTTDYETQIEEEKLNLELKISDEVLDNISNYEQVLKNIFIGPRSSAPVKYPEFGVKKFWSVLELLQNGFYNPNNQLLLPVEFGRFKEYKESFSFLQLFSCKQSLEINELEQFENYEDEYLQSGRKGGFGSTGG